MSTTLSMWLGIAFVLIGVAATIIQAWLWSFPMAPDPGGPDPNGKSTAPPLWTLVHRLLGLFFVLIYVVLMVEMVPRLWEYQIELPSRTVMHACMGIIIGVLLITKIAIIRWFQHFGTSLPTLGLMILMCTLILGTLSIPYALKAHDFGDIMSPANLKRVAKTLENVPFEESVSRDELLTEESMSHGRSVLVEKCVACHDIRTILKRPRTGKKWLSTVLRMQTLPAIGSVKILDADVAPVTAYLIAINPAITQKRKADNAARKEKSRAKERAASVLGTKPTLTPEEGLPEAPPFDDAKAEELVVEKCSECHEMDDVDNHGGDDRAGWSKVIQEMVEEGAEFADEEISTILTWLVRHHGPEK